MLDLAESFVEYGDIDALAEVVERRLTQESDRIQLSRAAKMKYSKKRMSDDYLKLYQELVKSSIRG